MSTVRLAKFSFVLSLFIIGIISMYIWQNYSIGITIAVGMALVFASVYEHKRKVSDIRTAYSYENK
jgi:heme exporter protein D